MSIDVLVESADGTVRMTPLVSRPELVRRWLPLARELDLGWVPLLQTGIPFYRDDVPELLAELERLREHVSTLGPDWEPMLEDLAKLRGELQRVDFEAGETVFVG